MKPEIMLPGLGKRTKVTNPSIDNTDTGNALELKATKIETASSRHKTRSASESFLFVCFESRDGNLWSMRYWQLSSPSVTNSSILTSSSNQNSRRKARENRERKTTERYKEGGSQLRGRIVQSECQTDRTVHNKCAAFVVGTIS